MVNIKAFFHNIKISAHISDQLKTLQKNKNMKKKTKKKMKNTCECQQKITFLTFMIYIR